MESHLRNSTWVFFIGLLTLGACGKESKPSHIVGMDVLNPSQQSLLKGAVEEFNSNSGSTLIVFEDQGGFPIQVRSTPSAELEAIEPPQPLRLGHATLSAKDCLVQMNDKIFNEEKKAFYILVQWHEFGHCFGLNHEDDPRQVMHSINHPLPFYGPDAVRGFFQRLLTSVDLR